MASINAGSTGSKRELTPEGNHVARCYGMIELGTVWEEILGKSKRLRKCRITWELPNETRVFKEEDGPKPFSISKEYTISMNEKSNMRKDLKSWRGRDFTEEEAKSFDILKLLGAPCLLNVIHSISRSGTKYSQVASISPVPKGMNVPPQVNKNLVLTYDDWNEEVFKELPDFITDVMKRSEEYEAMRQPQNHHLQPEPATTNVVEPDDDLPF